MTTRPSPLAIAVAGLVISGCPARFHPSGATATSVGGDSTAGDEADNGDDDGVDAGSTAETSDATTGASDATESSATTSASAADDTTSGGRTNDFAVAFTGDGGVKSVAPFDLVTDDFTVDMWIRIDDPENVEGVIITHRGIDEVAWSLFIDDLGLLFMMRDEIADVHLLGYGPSPDEIGSGWHHVAVTRDDGALVMYLDGSMVTSAPSSAAGVAQPLARLLVGYNWDADGNQIQTLRGMSVDDVRVTDHARFGPDFVPPSEIVLDGGTLVALLFDEGEGSNIDDAASDMIFELQAAAWTDGHAAE